jgi:pilus assembly protein CpaE
MAAIERLRAGSPAVAIFAISAGAEPDLILQAMRAGANEFFPWTDGPPTAASRTMEEAFQGAVRRTAARRDAATAGARPPCVTHVFLGAKGGAGTTTVSVNCAVELARLTKRPTVIVDLKTCLGEVALFLGVRPRFTVLDAVENLHRLDRDFLRELVSKHKSGLDILAGSEQFDRPNATDAGAIEELLRVLARTYDYIVVDAGNTINACSVAALYAADTIFLVANPDVPSIRNAQRLVDRVRQLGAGSRARPVLLNRVVRPAHDRAQADRDRARLRHPSHVLERLPDGVDRAQLGRAARADEPLRDLASQFGASRGSCWARQDEKPHAEKRKAFLGFLRP